MHAHTDTETVISRPDSSPWTEKWGSCWQTTKVVENPESCASKNPSPEWVDHFWVCNWPANVKDPAAVENGKTVKSHCWSRIFDLVFVALEKTPPPPPTHTHTHITKSEWWRSRLAVFTETRTKNWAALIFECKMPSYCFLKTMKAPRSKHTRTEEVEAEHLLTGHG